MLCAEYYGWTEQESDAASVGFADELEALWAAKGEIRRTAGLKGQR